MASIVATASAKDQRQRLKFVLVRRIQKDVSMNWSDIQFIVEWLTHKEAL